MSEKRLVGPVGVVLTAVAHGLGALNPPEANAASTAIVNGAQMFQPIDGFGFAELFGHLPSLSWEMSS
jgi:hypothetical protein